MIMFNKIAIFLFLLKSTFSDKPNIIFILADDLGWNDVGFHGSADIRTPNIDALAYTGLALHHYYVAPICTPSRSALMTGKHPIRTGMQHTVLFGAEPRGLPLAERLLPERLRALGYATHIVGKWHLGCFRRAYTPLARGFDSHLGFWTGHQDYNDHTAAEGGAWGLDMRRGMEVAYDLHGQYSTDVFGAEAVRLINSHDRQRPLFLYLAHAAVHSGNPYNPLPAPDERVKRFGRLGYERARFAAMLEKLDDSVGAVVAALEKRGMLENSIIVFSSDNGGPAEGFNLNAASNFPLRGVKNTLWEGGVRGAGLVWSGGFKKPRLAMQRMHIMDWLPTLLAAAGGNQSALKPEIDGLDMWNALKDDTPSPRTEILHNIDDIYGSSALTVDQYKIVKGTNYGGAWDNWYGPSGRNFDYNSSAVINSPAGLALKKINKVITPDKIAVLRHSATITCKQDDDALACKPLEAVCLFNVLEDPCERHDLAGEKKEIVANLLTILERYNRTAIPPGNLPLDPRGDPKFWNYTFTNFGDFI